MTLLLIRTKLNPPTLLPATLRRQRLTERFDAAIRRRLTLISAPAGYGKTTLLADWLDERQNRPRAHQEETGAPINGATPSATMPEVAWLTLDDGDNDPQQLLTYLIASLHMLSPQSRTRASIALQATPAPSIEMIVADLLNDLAEIPSETLIVLDEYHSITSPAIHKAIGFLIDHLPPRAHLVIITRADPPIPLARLRARGYLAELRAGDLSFSPEETAAFLLETMELPLSRSQIATLLERTEGWPAGLQLIAIALRDRPDQAAFVESITANHRYIVDYLIEDVFARLSSHIQAFLLQTSILDRLSGPLCDAVLGITPSDQAAMRNMLEDVSQSPMVRRSSIPGNVQSYSRLILDALERDNLFLIPLDAERDWYRYHHLFGEMLRERLSDGTSAEQIAVLHRRASAWYAVHGMLGAAVNHALKAGAVNDVVSILEPIGLAMATRVGEATLRVWMPAIPEAMIRARPRLALLRAWLALADYEQEQAEEWLKVAEEALARVASGEIADISNVTNLRGEICAVRARLATQRGDAAQVVEYANLALSLLQTDNVALRTRVAKDLGYAHMTRRDFGLAEQAFAEAMTNGASAGYPYISFMATSDYAYVQYLRGSLRTAVLACRQMIALASERDILSAPGAGLPFLALADISRERQEFAGVLPALAEADSYISPNNTTSFICMILVEARTARAQNDSAAALAHIRRARFIAQRRHLAWAMAVIDALEAQLQIYLGDLATAERLIERAVISPLPAEFRFFPAATVYYYEHYSIAPLQLRLVRSRNEADPAALHSLIDDLTDRLIQADNLDLCWVQIKLRALQAQAYAALGKEAQALTILGHALSLGATEGFIRVFVEEGQPLADLIERGLALNAWATPQDDEELYSYIQHLHGFFGKHRSTDSSGQITRNSVTQAAQEDPLALPALPEPLSSREQEVLLLMADGQSNTEIAANLVIAVSTVKSHVNNIFSKLGVATRTQAIARARRLDLV